MDTIGRILSRCPFIWKGGSEHTQQVSQKIVLPRRDCGPSTRNTFMDPDSGETVTQYLDPNPLVDYPLREADHTVPIEDLPDAYFKVYANNSNHVVVIMPGLNSRVASPKYNNLTHFLLESGLSVVMSNNTLTDDMTTEDHMEKLIEQLRKIKIHIEQNSELICGCEEEELEYSLIGSSVGGEVVALAVNEFGPKGLVLLGPTYGWNGQEAWQTMIAGLAQHTGRLAVVYGGYEDSYISFGYADHMANVAKNATSTRVYEIERAGHSLTGWYDGGGIQDDLYTICGEIIVGANHPASINSPHLE